MTSIARLACLSVLALLPLLMLPLHAQAETLIQVTTTADDADANGNCTLREAIIAANTDAGRDGCAGGSGSDVILLAPGTYALSLTGSNEDAAFTGDLDVTGSVNLRGAGVDASIIAGVAAGEPDRVFHVLGSGSLGLFNVTVRGGRCAYGGGIFNDGTLIIADSRLQDNVASEGELACGHGSGTGISGGGGAIYNRGTLVIARTIVSGNRVVGYGGDLGDVAFPGGGLFNEGRATILKSRVNSNSAAGGGGIHNHGELTLTDSELSHNGARFWGAGLENLGTATLERVTVASNADGGIINGDWRGGDATLTIRNSTLASNRSSRVSGAIHNFGGPIEIRSSTIAGNPGGGIGGDTATVRLFATIVANGASADCEGSVVSLGHNLDGDNTCGLGLTELPATDPHLGPLADNGGLTPTRPLLVDSPAIDQIGKAECGSLTDQRGTARPEPAKGRCDIGAYQVLAGRRDQTARRGGLPTAGVVGNAGCAVAYDTQVGRVAGDRRPHSQRVCRTGLLREWPLCLCDLWGGERGGRPAFTGRRGSYPRVVLLSAAAMRRNGAEVAHETAMYGERLEIATSRRLDRRVRLFCHE